MKKNAEKSFGILFSIVFFIVGLFPLLHDQPLRVWAIIVALTFLSIAFLKPKLLKYLNLGWIKIGEMLGKVVAPIIMLLIFLLVVTPTSLLLRLFKKDLLSLKLDKSKKSYWINRKNNITSMNNQF
jgi:hypothetical protein